MLLLRAELIKLNRPLLWGVAATAALFCVLLAVGGAHNAAQMTARSAGPLPSCAQLLPRLPAGTTCAQAEAAARARLARYLGQRGQVAGQLTPAAAGAEAAGLMASLPWTSTCTRRCAPAPAVSCSSTPRPRSCCWACGRRPTAAPCCRPR